MTSPFNPTYYYRLSNSITGANLTLSLGNVTSQGSLPSSPQMGPIQTYSTENWQLFHDSGLYFIRSYAYGSSYQLGVNSSNVAVPQMLPTGPGLGMQWNLTKGLWSTYVFTNMLVGQGNTLDLTTDNKSIIMNTDGTGSGWVIDINISAGRVTNPGMLSTFASTETMATSVSTSTAISVATAPATATQSSAAATQLSLATTTQSSSATMPLNSSGLSYSAVAGIGVGSAVGGITVTAIILFIYFTRCRVQQPQATTLPASLKPSVKLLSELDSDKFARSELQA